ncbi:MAG: hypothetical protein JW793_10775 [Acidobacteria bacterium]|nr:hypothetical protein [Acidobacteriota bacterium]
MMARSFLKTLFFIGFLFPFAAQAQEIDKYKSFNRFAGMVPRIDFYASKRQSIDPYVKPAAEAVQKLQSLLGDDLPKGAIFICSSLEQKDSIYEPIILKMGYAWTLTLETPEVRADEMLAQMKSMMGEEIPAEIMERIKKRPTDMMASAEGRMVAETVRQIAYAVIQTSFAKNLRYRSSRLNDMGKSPLPDWLDIGIGAYVTGYDPNLNYLQQNMQQSFPLEDVLTMSRPFVASTFLGTGTNGGSEGMSGSRSGRGGFNGGQGFPSGGFGAMGQGGFPPTGGFGAMGQGGLPPSGGFGAMGSGGGMPSGSGDSQGSQGRSGASQGGFQRTIPKDEQDQMLFDGQSSTFFAFLLEKVGVEKVRELIQSVQQGVEGRDFVARPDMLGDDYGKIEEEWIEWVGNIKPPAEPTGRKPAPKQM